MEERTGRRSILPRTTTPLHHRQRRRYRVHFWQLHVAIARGIALDFRVRYCILPLVRACSITACRHRASDRAALERYTHARIYERDRCLGESGVDYILTWRIAVGLLIYTHEGPINGMGGQKLAESGRALHSDSVRVDPFPKRRVLGLVVVNFTQTPVATQLDLLGARCAGSPHEGVPFHVVGIEEMDFLHGRFGNGCGSSSSTAQGASASGMARAT